MSIIQNDSKTTAETRQPLAGMEANARDQSPQSLLEKTRELKVGQKVMELWRQGNNDRADYLERQAEILKNWDSVDFYNDTSGPWSGSSQLHLPLTFTACKTLHARFLQALFSMDPPFVTKARTEAYSDRVRNVQEVLAYALKDWANHYQGIESTADEWLWSWITTGRGILKLRWDKTYTRFIDVEQSVVPRRETVVDPETGDYKDKITPEIVTKEVPVTRLKYQGPIAELRNIEDVLILGGHGDPDLADAVLDSYQLTASDLWTQADCGVFDVDVVDKLVKGGKDRVEAVDTSGLKQNRADNAGQGNINTEAALDRYQVIEAYLKLDVDGSGITTEVVVWVAARTNEILRANYLDRLNRAGDRPFATIDYYRRPNQENPIGLVEIMMPLAMEMDCLHNLRVDFGTLAAMPFGFVRANSSLEPETIELAPGALIPVDNPQADVYFPNLGNRTAFGFQEEQSLNQYLERLTGVNDLTLGAMGGSQGATRTATGARALLGESNANLDVFLRRLQQGWRKVLRYMLGMIQQRIPAGFAFRVTGEDGQDYWRYIRDREDIAGFFDFELSGNTANSNNQLQQQQTLEIYQMLQNPLLIQAGLVTPAGIYEAARAVLLTKGIKDVAKYIQAPPQYLYIPTPAEEANRLLRGIPVPVLPNSDHEGFLAYFQEIHDSDELLGQFSEQDAITLASQAKKHQEMMAAMQQMAAQASNNRQMQANAEQSAQQAPVQISAPGPVATGQGDA